MKIDKENDNYIPGQYNVICDGCGRKIKSSEARMRWDGFLVCPQDWEPKHDQDMKSPIIRDGRQPYKVQLDESIDDTLFDDIPLGPEES